jgi:regulator of sirC expression with transglutaminase-like and TPR domain
MKMLFSVPSPLAYFTSLVMSDAEFPLLEAAISLVQDEDPDLDVQQVLSDVDQLLARIKRRIPADAGDLQKLRALNQFFYRDLAFCGNVNDYYDPDNSFVSVVLRTRRAIPITLAVVWMELAQGLGLSARGIAFPGHFMMKVNLPEGQVVMDPLDGQSLSRENLAERLDPQHKRNGLSDDFEVPLGLYLQVAPPRDIIARMLHNLKAIHASQEDWPRLIATQNRLIILLPKAWDEYRDRGLAYAAVGDAELALRDLETYLHNADAALDVQAIALRVAELRGAIN